MCTDAIASGAVIAAKRQQVEAEKIEELSLSTVTDPEFCFRSTANKHLNVTCYGSSSSKTPTQYMNAAKLLGYVLAKRGHICINGAGRYGCMAAMNDGVHAGDGHARGVTHEMWAVDNGYRDTKSENKILKNSGYHPIFDDATVLRDTDIAQKPTSAEEASNDCRNTKSLQRSGSIRELLVAGGGDLQQRKKLLVANTDAVIVLPGGPGTWDELWEMACARHIKLNDLPIVCVNVEGYYDPFREMLHRAYEDKLIVMEPDAVVWFADSVEEAVRFIENPAEETKPTAGRALPWRKPKQPPHQNLWWDTSQTFVTGVLFGIVMATTVAAAAARRG